MLDQAQRRNHFFIRCWVAFVLLVIYLPILCSSLAGLSKSRFFTFPVREFSFTWWEKIFASMEIKTLLSNSLSIAVLVTLISVVLAFFGALAFARFDWKGRKLYQKLILMPIFFPQAVLGLALLLWMNTLGLMPSWKTAVLAHLVWIVPVVTLVIAIRVYSYDATLEDAAADLGASRWQIFREITLPLLWPGIWSGALFAFLLSWGNFPLSLYTAGTDSTIPKWLYAKMIAGYTPMVPALGTMSTLGAIIVLALVGLLVVGLRRLRQV